MPASPLTKSAAAKASLAAKVGLGVAAAAVVGVVLSLPDIPNPTHQAPDLTPAQEGGEAVAIRPVNFSSMGRSLTLAAEFPPAPEVQPPDAGTGGGGVDPSSPPISPSAPSIRFLGAIAEPGRYVALLNINGRQKFIAPGDLFQGIRVVDCSAAEVAIQIENPDGSISERQTIAIAERSGPGWTAAAPSASPEAGAAVLSGDAPPSATPAAMPGLPPGFTPPQGMTPQQLEQFRREFQARQAERGDGSQ